MQSPLTSLCQKGCGIVALFGALLTCFLCWPAASGQDSYFYRDGKKQPLRVSEIWAAAQVDAATDNEDLKQQPAFDLKRKAGRIHRDVLITPVRPEASRAERQNLERELRNKRGVKRPLRGAMVPG